MKFLNKFSKNLLEKRPLLWHTSSIQLFGVSAILWLLSYLIGYSTLSLYNLRNYKVTEHYDKSGFVLFHIAVVIIIIAIWAFYFYKNNAFKSIYPLGKLYFHKMFLLLFVPFFLLISLYFPFTKGAYHKTENLLSKEELFKDYQTISLAEAFLPTSSDNYKLEQKVYPGPFPMSQIVYDDENARWNSEFLKIYQADSLEKIVDYDYSDYNTSLVQNKKIQFYREKYFPIDSCESESAIYKFYIFDGQKDHLELNSIWNFSGSGLISSFDPLFKNSSLKSYRKNYAEIVHTSSNKEDWDEIQKIIENALVVFQKYGVYHDVNSKEIVQYLKIKKFKNLNGIISNYRFTQEGLDNKLRERKISFEDYKKMSFTRKLEFYPVFCINQSELTEIYSNYNNTLLPFIDFDELFFFLFFALALTLFFVFFQIVKPIPFLLSLPAWGVLIILVGLFLIFSDNHYYSRTREIKVFLLLFAVVQITNFLLLKFGKSGKKILDVTISMAIVSAGFILPFILTIIHYASKYRVTERCNNSYNEFLFKGALLSPFAIWIGAFLGIMLALFLARPWMAKKE